LSNSIPEERSGREIRLLVLVIIVAVAGLLVLARFRFPAAEIVTVSPTPTPLERIIAHGPFDELAGAVAAAVARATPLVVVVEFESAPDPASKKGNETPAASPPAIIRRSIPALRVAPDRLFSILPSGMHPVSVNGRMPQVLGQDPRRAVVLLAAPLPPTAAPPHAVDFSSAISSLSAYRYVVAVEAADAGPAGRLAFLPRVDALTTEPWDSPIWRIGGHSDVQPGSFLFTMDGQLVGMAVPQGDGVAILTAAMIDRLVRELARSAAAEASNGPPGGQ
jgi:hypothetical protein